VMSFPAALPAGGAVAPPDVPLLVPAGVVAVDPHPAANAAVAIVAITIETLPGNCLSRRI
jgi:hypothetical protein